MTVLLLRLAGPLQAWGASSRFVRRETRTEPTKSGVLGLLAAAQGRRRTDPLEDLVCLRFGVRLDQPGRLVRDFQTARTLDGGTSMPLSYRYYLGDAVFLAALEGDGEMLEALDYALKHPSFPLYLGRRSCPPAGPVTQGIRGGTVESAFSAEPWTAARWVMRRGPVAVQREVVRDKASAEERGEIVRDEPISFDPNRREYGWRTVVRETVVVANPLAGSALSEIQEGAGPGRPPAFDLLEHDPFGVV